MEVWLCGDDRVGRGMGIKVTHIISALGCGGAEMMLYKLLSSAQSTVFDFRVVSLTQTGPVGEKIRALAVPVLTLGMRRGVPNALAVLRLTRLLRHDPLHVIRPVWIQV